MQLRQTSLKTSGFSADAWMLEGNYCRGGEGFAVADSWRRHREGAVPISRPYTNRHQGICYTTFRATCSQKHDPQTPECIWEHVAPQTIISSRFRAFFFHANMAIQADEDFLEEAPTTCAVVSNHICDDAEKAQTSNRPPGPEGGEETAN